MDIWRRLFNPMMSLMLSLDGFVSRFVKEYLKAKETGEGGEPSLAGTQVFCSSFSTIWRCAKIPS